MPHDVYDCMTQTKGVDTIYKTNDTCRVVDGARTVWHIRTKGLEGLQGKASLCDVSFSALLTHTSVTNRSPVPLPLLLGPQTISQKCLWVSPITAPFIHLFYLLCLSTHFVTCNASGQPRSCLPPPTSSVCTPPFSVPLPFLPCFEAC